MRSLLRYAALALVLCAPLAYADDLADEADVQFELGAKKYQAGDYLGALEHFLTSNRLVSNKNVLYNIARCYEQLHRFPDAYRAYGRALDAETAPDRKKDLEIALQRIAPKVAILDVVTDPPGATVYLDRKDLGSRGNTPRKLGLEAGKYKIIVELPGYEPATSDNVTIEIGAQKTVTLKLEPILATLNIGGEHAGAAVRLDKADGPVICTIPCSGKVAPGKHTLFITREGYKRAEVSVDLPPKQTVNIAPKLDYVTGDVVASADVSEALIEIDGKPYGFTPAVLHVPVGKHTMTISRSGFKAVTKSIDVSETKELRVDATLTEVTEVTAASRTQEAVEDAPSSVSIIPSVELRGMGYPTIADALRGVRGAYVTDDRHYAQVGFRGFSNLGDYGNRVLVLVDGHPINDNYVGSSYVGFDARTDLEDVERIEVVRGPGSVLYGTGAFFGVINLVTRSRGMPTRVDASVSTVDHGVTRARTSAYVRLGPDSGAWISFAAARGFGRDFFFPELVSPTFDGNVRNSDHFDAGTIAGRFFYKAFTLQWQFHERTKVLPTAAFSTLPGDPRTRLTDRRSFIEARFEPKFGDKLQSFTRAHLNFYDFIGKYAYDLADEGLQRETFHGVWAGVEQRFAFEPSSKVRITVGGEGIRHLKASQFGQTELGPDPYLSSSDPYTSGAGYLLADVSPAKGFKASGGVRYDWYSTFGGSLNPRVAFIVKPWTNGVVKLLGGKAFRAPSVYERVYISPTNKGNDNLKPENVWSGELEISHRFSSTVVATGSTWANWVNDLIVQRGAGTDVDPNFYENSKKPVLTYGVDGEIRRDFRDGWMLAGHLTLQRARYLKNTDGELRNVPNSPEILGAVRGGVPIIARALMFTSRVTYIGPRWDRFDTVHDENGDLAPHQDKSDPGLLWDFVFTGEAERSGIRYGVGVYNAFDWRWSAPVSREFTQRLMLQAGRTLYASASIAF
jgi:outer membrane receptor for ferrienterochelin and colicin